MINNDIYEPLEDLEPVQKPAKNLPKGWTWISHWDGSGSLHAPDGRRFFAYDLMTSEYVEPKTEKWTLWNGYPEERMSLQSFKEFAEKEINQLLGS